MENNLKDDDTGKPLHLYEKLLIIFEALLACVANVFVAWDQHKNAEKTIPKYL